MNRGSTEIIAGVHVYGSRRGYGTLARSNDVDDREDAALSGIGFGQATDARVLSSLANAVTALGRPLPGGRFAITRAMRGGVDDAGRPTLLLCTLLFTPEVYVERVRHHLATLLGDPSLWDQQRYLDPDRRPVAPDQRRPVAPDQRRPVAAGDPPPSLLPPLSITLPPLPERIPTAHDLAIADAWLRVDDSRDSIALFPPGSESAILALPQVLARDDALRYRWGVRLLGLDAGADIATALPGVGRGRRRVLDCALDDAPRSEWLAFLVSRHAISTPLVLRRATTHIEELASGSSRIPRPQRSGRAISRSALVLTAGGVTSLALIVAILLVLSARVRQRDDGMNPREMPSPIATTNGAASEPSAAPKRSQTPPTPGATIDKPATASADVATDSDASNGRRTRGAGPSNPAHAASDRARESLVGPPAPDLEEGSDGGATHGDSAPPSEDSTSPPSSSSSPTNPSPSTPIASAEARLRELVSMSPEQRGDEIRFDGSMVDVLTILTDRLRVIGSDGAFVPPADPSRADDARSATLAARTEEAARLSAVAASVAKSLRLVWRAQSAPSSGGASPDSQPDSPPGSQPASPPASQSGVHPETLPDALDAFAQLLRAARHRGGEPWNSLEQMRPILNALAVVIDAIEGVVTAQGLVHQINSGLKAIPGAEALGVPLPFDPTQLDELGIALDRFKRDFGSWSKRHAALVGPGTTR